MKDDFSYGFDMGVVLGGLMGLAFGMYVTLGIVFIAYTPDNNKVKCDEVIVYEDGAKVCEIFLRKSVDGKQIDVNGFDESDRI